MARESDASHPGDPIPDDLPLWEVFVQSATGSAHEHAGSVHASDGEMALQNARDVYSRRGTMTSIWVVPSGAIVASASADAASFFDPSQDKIYRHPQFYQVAKGTGE